MKNAGTKILNVLKVMLYVIVFVTVVILAIRFIFQRVISFTSEANYKISEIKTMKLGGYDQKVLIEGKKKDSPLLITLHGGPSIPYPFGVSQRGNNEELAEHFILVEWDQYGCGINYTDVSELNIQDYINMTEDLIKQMKKEYPNNKLYVFGMSWGTILGAHAAIDLADIIDGYFSYGTFTSIKTMKEDMISKLSSYKITEEEKKVIDKSMIDNDSVTLMDLLEITTKYIKDYQRQPDALDYIVPKITRAFVSPDYSLKDFYNASKYFIKESNKAFDEIYTIDLTEIQKSIKIPYYIIHSEYDNQTPKYVLDTLKDNNKYVELYELENSGHIPSRKASYKLNKYLLEISLVEQSL